MAQTIILNINTDAVVAHTARLSQISKSALPVSIRQALNKAAFDVKTRTMPITNKVFIHRKPTFWKATSKVKPATGFDIQTMQSIVGFIPEGNEKEKGGATQDLEQQEHGGDIDHRAFVPLRTARIGRSWRRNVKNDLRMSQIRRQILDSKNTNLHSVANNKERFVVSAIHVGVGGFVIGTDKRKNSRMLMRIDAIKRKGGNSIVRSTPIYSVKAGRQVHPKATHFMEQASVLSAKKLENFYLIEAEKRINRIK